MPIEPKASLEFAEYTSVPDDCASARRYASRLDAALSSLRQRVQRADSNLAITQVLVTELPTSSRRAMALAELAIARELLEM